MMDEREDIAVPPQVVQEAYDHAVVAIKQAIIRQQGRAARQVNQVQLALYFGIGKYVSDNSRSGYWNSGAIDYISRKLKSEMPGLRGFSPTNIKMMRLFYEAWGSMLSMSPLQQNTAQNIEKTDIVKSSDATDDLAVIPLEQYAGADVMRDFTAISFSHHCIIINKVKDEAERLYYIHLCSARKLSVSQLKTAIGRDEYHHRGQMPNNFTTTLGDSRMAVKAVEMFRDSYMLDFINVEELGARDIEDVDERVVENAVRDYAKPMGVATYLTGDDMPEKLLKALPDAESLRKLL